MRAFFSAPNADVAAFIRLSTYASEVVSEESILETIYLNSFVTSTKLTVEPSALRMSKRKANNPRAEDGKYIASV